MFFSTLENVTIKEIYDLFMEAFEGFQITKECTLQLFREMLRSNDYHPLFSMGAFDESTNKIIGFVLNNVKTINDKKRRMQFWWQQSLNIAGKM